MNLLKDWINYRMLTAILYIILVFVGFPFLNDLYISETGSYLDIIVIFPVIVGVLFIYSQMIFREEVSFQSFQQFKKAKNIKSLMENKYIDKEILAHYVEYDKIVNNNFPDFYDIMLKLNIMNQNHKEIIIGESFKKKFTLRIPEIPNEVVKYISSFFMIFYTMINLFFLINFFLNNEINFISQLIYIGISFLYGFYLIYLFSSFLLNHRFEILNKKQYIQLRKNRDNTYLTLYKNANKSRLFLTMLEFSQTIETNLTLIGFEELSEHDFYFHIEKLKENKSKIEDIYNEFANMEKTKENILAVQRQLNGITSFSKFIK